MSRFASLLAVTLICGFGAAPAPAVAQASLSWSGSRPVDPQASGVALNRVACPTVTQCTAVDGNGHAVTFNPQSPQAITTAIVSTHDLSGIACPSTTQCTVVDVNGGATTFNPQSTAGGSPTEIDPGAIPLGLACPSTAQCTAVDLKGQVVTFNPHALASAPRPTVLDPNQLLISVRCPGESTTWCVAVDTTGNVIGFNPAGGAQPAVQMDSVQGASVQGAACSPAPSSSQCVLVDDAANAFAFTAPPNQPPAHGSQGSAETGPQAAVPTAVECPDNSTCVVVDQHGQEATFNPELPIAAPAPVDPGQVLSDLSCPSATQCTAVDRDGQESTFNPGSPGTYSRAPIDGRTNLVSLSCPSTGQCTAIDVGGSEATFAPGSSAAPKTAVIDPSTSGLFGIACPGTSQCTAVDNQGGEVTFNPASPGSPTPTPAAGGHALYGIACAAATECTAVDDVGQEVTFNPRSPGKPSPATIDSGHALLAVACPSTGQCSAVDDRGAEVTFNPLSPGAPGAHLVDRVPASALTCPTTAQCTAVDGSGDEVTFDPDAPSHASALAIDPSGQLSAIACRTQTDCVAVDQSGRTVEGDPRGTGAWSSHSLGTNSLTGIACPSTRECAAVDQPGDAFVGSSGPLPPVPGGLSSPRTAGLPQQGQALGIRHARWSQSPTSYTYQWERCTAKGTRCKRIAGADAPNYRLTHADVGHRIRVQESGWNITGGGAPRTSRASGIVGGLVSTAAKLSGVSRAPRLAFSLRAHRGTTPLTRIQAVLSAGLSLRTSRGIAVTTSGKSAHHYAVSARGRRLTVTLQKAAATVRIHIPAHDLLVGSRLQREVKAHRREKLTLTLTALQRDGGSTVEKLTLVA